MRIRKIVKFYLRKTRVGKGTRTIQKSTRNSTLSPKKTKMKKNYVNDFFDLAVRSPFPLENSFCDWSMMQGAVQ